MGLQHGGFCYDCGSSIVDEPCVCMKYKELEKVNEELKKDLEGTRMALEGTRKALEEERGRNDHLVGLINALRQNEMKLKHDYEQLSNAYRSLLRRKCGVAD